ncbi:hypothetical protein KP509_05G065200 [Ceratopteris richardii]|nr:hypothetical protein KP509_05G065200 [Ceratopteris richardii]
METLAAVGSYLVSMLADCGAFDEANEVLERLPSCNERSWTSLMSAYYDDNQPQKASILYQKMQEHGVIPSTFTLVVVLKTCAALKYMSQGKQIHMNVVYTGYERDVFVGNALVDMYSKCGSFMDGLEVCKMLPVRDVVTWTAIITGYIEYGHYKEAMTCFDAMHEDGVAPNVVTYICILRAIAGTYSLRNAHEVHMQVVLCGYEQDQAVGNTLVAMYGKCGFLSCAQGVFSRLHFRNVVSWNSLIAGYAEHDFDESVVKAYKQMQTESVPPDLVTMVYALKACGSLKAINMGHIIHADAVMKGVDDLSVGNATVDMYARCNFIADAQVALIRLPVKDVVSWNSLIFGYAEQGSCEEVFECIGKMQKDGIAPDSVTYVMCLKACNSSEWSSVRGDVLHTQIIYLGFENNAIVGSALVDMYAKAGLLMDAEKVFNDLPNPHVMVWTALIAGYAQHGSFISAHKCYEKMQLKGICPDQGIFVCLLKAVKDVGAIFVVHELHADVIKRGYDQDILICSILVDIYAKFGAILEAQSVFNRLPIRDVVSWSALMRGYGMNHDGKNALKCFEKMKNEGIKLDEVMFTCLLFACSRSQLIIKGQEFFHGISEHGFVPSVGHYTCMVDLLSKLGNLIEAEKFTEAMSSPPVLTTLLAACKSHGDSTLGQHCFHELTK